MKLPILGLCLALVFVMALPGARGQAPSAPAAQSSGQPSGAAFDLAKRIEDVKQKGQFQPRGRRNPFASPLSEIGTISPLVVEEFSLEEQEKLLKSAEGISLPNIKALMALENHEGAVREAVLLREKLEAKRGRFSPANAERVRRILEELDALLKEMGKALKEVVLAEAQKALARASQLFKGEEYQAVIDTVTLLDGYVPDLAGASEEIKDIVQQASALANRARLHLEFEELKVEISGVIWSPERSIAIINGESKVPDEEVKVGDLTLEVKAIKPGKVVFLYKGEEISKALHY